MIIFPVGIVVAAVIFAATSDEGPLAGEVYSKSTLFELFRIEVVDGLLFGRLFQFIFLFCG